MNIQIYTKNLELTLEIEQYVREKVSGLSKFFDNILEARVEISKTTEHHRHGDIYYAEVNLKVPNRLIRSVSQKENLWLAIDEVKDELQREIKKYKEKQKTKVLKGARFLRYFKLIDPTALIRKIKTRKGEEEEL